MLRLDFMDKIVLGIEWELLVDDMQVKYRQHLPAYMYYQMICSKLMCKRNLSYRNPIHC